jgi:hypothetical protein
MPCGMGIADRMWTRPMHLRHSLILFGCCALGSGCNVAVNFARDTVFEAKRVTDECCERIRNRSVANAAWDDFQKCAPKGSYSAHYARGFKDGFADYLYAGGNGDQPPTLPECYWGVRYQTPEGYQAIQDWFAGYPQGMAAAQQSGLRELVVFPIDDPDPDWAAIHPYPVPPALQITAPGPPSAPIQLEMPKSILQPNKPTELSPPRQDSPYAPRHGASGPQGAGSARSGGPDSADNPKPD